MAEFDAEELGKRLEALNREQLAVLQRQAEQLLDEMRRAGPMRAGVEGGGPIPGARRRRKAAR